MKIAIASLLVLSLFMFSCKHDKKDMIRGQWYGEQLQNTEMDSVFRLTQNDIDTIGKNTTAETNIELYGTTNVDSLRRELQLQQDEVKSLQLKAVHNTNFNFFSDSLVAISFGFRIDTSKWYFINDKQLEMIEMTGEGKGSKLQMDVLTLTDKALSLKFELESTFSTVTFGRDKK